MANVSKKYIEGSELCEILGLTPRRLTRLRQEKVIPYFDLGHRTKLYKLDEVQRALDRLRVKGLGEGGVR